MLGIMEHGDPTADNGVNGPVLDWDGATKPTDAQQVYVTGTATKVAEKITDALETGDVYINGDLEDADVDNFTIPYGRTLYVTGNVGDSATAMSKITVDGTLMVGGDLYTDAQTVNDIGVKGDWYVTDNTTVDGTATVEGNIEVTDVKVLTVEGKLYGGSISSSGATGADLVVNGHVEIAGNVVLNDVKVYSSTSLLVDGKLECNTLTVGDSATGDAGRVEADSVDATTITVTETGSSLTVVGAVKGNVTVKDASFTSNGVNGNLTVEGPASVSAGEVTGTVNTDKAEGDDIVYTVKETNSATADNQSVYGA